MPREPPSDGSDDYEPDNSDSDSDSISDAPPPRRSRDRYNVSQRQPLVHVTIPGIRTRSSNARAGSFSAVNRPRRPGVVEISMKRKERSDMHTIGYTSSDSDSESDSKPVYQPRPSRMVGVKRKNMGEESTSVTDSDSDSNHWMPPEDPGRPQMSTPRKGEVVGHAVTPGIQAKGSTSRNADGVGYMTDGDMEEDVLFKARSRCMQLLSDLHSVKGWMHSANLYDGAPAYIRDILDQQQV